MLRAPLITDESAVAILAMVFEVDRLTNDFLKHYSFDTARKCLFISRLKFSIIIMGLGHTERSAHEKVN
jgi:hypothetical protein